MVKSTYKDKEDEGQFKRVLEQNEMDQEEN